MHRTFLLAAFGWIVLSGATFAQQPEKAVGVRGSSTDKPVRVYARLHALCIGINDYASPDVPDLSYAEADARDVADVLKTLYGFDDVRVLLGKEATKKRISDAIADLFDPDHIGASDAVIIYFSGHGQTVKQGAAEGGYLIPQDAAISLKDVRNPAPYRRDALRMDDLRTDADGVPAKHVLFLIDACYSGYLASRSVSASPELAAALKYPARQVITAGTSGEESLEHNAWGHGAFTFKLLEILRAEDRPLQASRLGVMLKERVPREVEAKFGARRSLSPQAKYLSGDGDFLFIRPGTLLNAESESTRPPVEPPAADPVALLKQGDRKAIEKLVSDGDFQAAMDKLSTYESEYDADDFARRLKPMLTARLTKKHTQSNPPAADPPARPKTAKPSQNGLLAVGELAPNWILKTPHGRSVSLRNDLSGKVVLMVFWATWCGPCKKSMPAIQKVYDKFKANKDVAVYGVNAADGKGDPTTYMREKQLTFGLLINGDETANAYKVKGIPTFYVIGKDGKVVFAQSGEPPDLEAIINDALK